MAATAFSLFHFRKRLGYIRNINVREGSERRHPPCPSPNAISSHCSYFLSRWASQQGFREYGIYLTFSDLERIGWKKDEDDPLSQARVQTTSQISASEGG